jgi:hypothetical protein
MVLLFDSVAISVVCLGKNKVIGTQKRGNKINLKLFQVRCFFG